MLDKFEFWSRRRFRSWCPEAVGALLIGFPFSPLVYASRRLAAERIPYVVDIGDPWVLTIASGQSQNRKLGRLRARVAERRLWAGAAGAVVTTGSQSSALRALFPELQTLVRPNGFEPAYQSTSPMKAPLRSRSNSLLRLAHFGNIYAVRLEIAPFLTRLSRSGKWQQVELHQYGSDWTGALKAQRDVRVIFHEPRPWSEIVGLAAEYDLAVVVGNRDPTTLPSKTVEYLQLPIPRVAVVEDDKNHALAQYLADKPGWIVLCADGTDAADVIDRHVSRRWSSAELAPPATENWDHVSEEIVGFVLRALNVSVSRGQSVAEP